MIDRRQRRHHLGPGMSGIFAVLVACALLLAPAVLAGCGDGSSGGSSTSFTVSTQAAPTTVPPDPALTLATGVIDTWAEAMQKLVGLIEAKPDVSAIQPQVESLKEEYVQKLLEYGRQRLELSDAQKTQIDSLTFMGISALSVEPWYQSYMTLYEHYSTGNLEFSNLLASFNILTQYADFALLKQQEPEEAARLGIE